MVTANKPLKNLSTKSYESLHMKTIYCDVRNCEAPAIKKVSVSVKRAGDSIRNFCGGCLEAYTIGVQHGRKIELAEPRAKKTGSNSKIKKTAHTVAN